MFRNKFTTAILVIGATMVSAGPAIAQVADLPAPGVLSLVAIGIVGAIVLTKLRK